MLFVHGALSMFFGYALRPLISTEILDGGHSSAWLGLATMVFAVPPLVLAIPAGRLLDRTGERPWIVGGSIVYLVATLLVLLSTTFEGTVNLAMLVIASGVIGLGSLASILGSQTWVMHGAAAGRPDFWFGLYTFALTVGQLIAPALLWLPGAAERHTLATEPIAWTLVGVAVVAAVLGTFVPSHGSPASGGAAVRKVRSVVRRVRQGGRDDEGTVRGTDASAGRSRSGYAAPPTGEIEIPPGSARKPGANEAAGLGQDDDREGMLRASLRLTRREGVLRTLVASSLVIASIDIVIAYLPLLVRDRALDAAWIGGLLMARAVAGMVSRLFLSRLTSWFGRRNVMVTGAAIGAVALIAMATPVPAWALGVCIVVYGFAAGTVQPLTMSWMTLITPARERGLMTSLRMVGNRTGQTLVPVLIAGMSVIGGGALAFIVTGCTLVLSSLASMTAPDGDAVGRRER
ncbi:hypothetical protein GCM10011490_10610 [Pseudoclavibacter endophyticus]|nr:hypothetical protein GCM10011490_10610 [Pseudoclavibacter endophyticus]